MNFRKMSTGLIFLACLAAGGSQAAVPAKVSMPEDVPERPSLALLGLAIGAVAVRRRAERQP